MPYKIERLLEGKRKKYHRSESPTYRGKKCRIVKRFVNAVDEKTLIRWISR